MKALLRRPKRLAALALALLLTLALGGFVKAESGPDLARLTLENRLAELLVDLKLTRSQLVELRSVLVALKEERRARAIEAAALLEERKMAVLGGDGERKKEIDKELSELRSGRLAAIPEAKAFLEGLTERQQMVLSSLLGEPIAVRRQSPSGGPRNAIVQRFVFGRPSLGIPLGGADVDRLDILVELIDEVLQ